MRLIVLTLALWLLTSVAMADVIFPDDPYPPLRRRWPNPPAVTELPVRTPPTVPTEEPWHPNVDDVPDEAPEEMRIAVTALAGLTLLIFVASRQLERRSA